MLYAVVALVAYIIGVVIGEWRQGKETDAWRDFCHNQIDKIYRKIVEEPCMQCTKNPFGITWIGHDIRDPIYAADCKPEEIITNFDGEGERETATNGGTE